MAGNYPGIAAPVARAENRRMNRVIVLHVPVRALPGPEAFGALLARLPYARRLELERRDRAGLQAGLVGLSLALQAAERLSGAPMEEGQLRFPAGRKPFFAAGPDFSISHSAQRIAVAVSEGCAVGLDIEDAPDAGTGAGASAARARPSRGPDLRQWTAVEAVLKAAGRDIRSAHDVGIDASRSLGYLGGRAFHLVNVAIAGAVACLASDVRIDGLVVEEVAPRGVVRGRSRSAR
jgi:hypothetical protein